MPFGIKLPDEGKKKREGVLPVRVSTFDSFIGRHGFERGSTILCSGGPGTGKSTFCMQSLYNGLLRGEKSVYLSFEEQIEKLVAHNKISYGWDIERFKQNHNLFILRIDPFKIARSVESFLAQKRGDLLVSVEEIEFPFKPDRIVIDSLSALNIAFMGNMENYRYYIRYLFEMLEKFDSVNYIVSEMEQNSRSFSRAGVEEFLADGLIAFYNIVEEIGLERKRYIEIMKLRGTGHERKAISFRFAKNGIQILEKSVLSQKKH